jgi:predicted metal-dependent phosphoesterase TrpH
MNGTHMTIAADLHVHTRHSLCATIRPVDIESLARQRGLSAIAITDHNTMRGVDEVRAACGRSLHIIAGEEITTTRGEIIGYFLAHEIPAGRSPDETIAAIREQHGLVSIPHPFDRLRSSRLTRPEIERLLPQVDMIEAYNARDMLAFAKNPLLCAARTAGVVPIACSDAHTPVEIGRCRMLLDPFNSPTDFLKALRHARMVCRRSPLWVHLITKIVRSRRKKGGTSLTTGTAG